eukprot:gene12436-15635_t
MFAIYITAAFALVVSGPGVMGDSDDLSTQFQSYPTRPHPKGYVVYRTDTAPSITGRLDEAMWQAAEWTDEFVDVQGPDLPTPWYRTQVKMLWDDVYLYIGAKMEDPHPWADLTLHDSRVFHDNAFEVFIDPDGDNHMYYEVEVNAVDTIFDLLMVKPYRDGGPALTAFETVRSSEPTQWDGPTGWAPLKRAVHVDGTVNDGSAESKGWSVEMALPWSILCQAAMRACPPSDGDKWRINFSRMQWSVEWDTSSRKYYKQPPDQSANIWVWSPQAASGRNFGQYSRGYIHRCWVCCIGGVPVQQESAVSAGTDADNYDGGDDDDEEHGQPRRTLRLYINKESRIWEKIWPT